MAMTVKQIEDQIGTLSQPSKMPCYGFSISARRCNVGQRLAKVKGSVCAGCYALKGNYMFPVVQKALEKRYNGINLLVTYDDGTERNFEALELFCYS